MNKSFVKFSIILTKKQWTSLGKFLLMFSSDGTDLIQLFDVCENHKEELNEIDLHLLYFENLTKKGFQNLGSRLWSLTEDWFAFYSLNIDQEQKELTLNRAYNNHGLYDLADQKAKHLEKKWLKNQTLSLVENKAKVKLLHQQYYSDNPIKYKKGTNLLGKLIDAYLFDMHHQSATYLLELENWGRIKQIDFTSQKQMVKGITGFLPKDEVSAILTDLSLVIKTLDLDAFLSVREFLYAERLRVPSELHTLVTMYLINSTIKLWQKGSYTDSDENAKLIEYGLSSGVMMKSGRIPKIRFYNLLTTLGQLKSYEWNESFINRWKNHIETNDIESTASIANAIIAFIFEKYEKIVPLISGVEFDDYAEKIRALGIELIAWYMDRRDNYAFLRNFLMNFKRTLSRNEGHTSTYFVKSHINLAKVVESLIQQDFRRVKIDLDKYEFLIYRKWLQKEINRKASQS